MTTANLVASTNVTPGTLAYGFGIAGNGKTLYTVPAGKAVRVNSLVISGSTGTPINIYCQPNGAVSKILLAKLNTDSATGIATIDVLADYYLGEGDAIIANFVAALDFVLNGLLMS